jgi:hypothetical protein
VKRTPKSSSTLTSNSNPHFPCVAAEDRVAGRWGAPQRLVFHKEPIQPKHTGSLTFSHTRSPKETKSCEMQLPTN